ncbi:hypothetical protein U1Q18_004308 [Sarracenia purpurea var. burkii]
MTITTTTLPTRSTGRSRKRIETAVATIITDPEMRRTSAKQEKNRDRGGDDNHRSRDEKNERRRSREYSQDHERSHEPKAERAMEVREAPAVEGRRRLRPGSDDGGRRREGIGRWRAATGRRRRNQY